MEDLDFDLFHYYSTPDDGRLDGVTIFAFHTKRLQAYRDDWSLQEILVFEAILNRSRRFYHKKFFYQQNRLMEELRIGETLLRDITNNLIALNFLSVTRKKNKADRKNYYRVNFDNIINNLDKIYDFNKFPDDGKEYFIEMFKNFFDYFRQSKTYRLEGKREDVRHFSGTGQAFKPINIEDDIPPEMRGSIIES